MGPAAPLARALVEVRCRVAFHGSTRTDAGVLSLHGLDDLAAELHRLAVQGRWSEMAGRVSDDVVRLFTAVAPYDRLAAEVERRFGGIVDVVALGFTPRTPGGLQRELIEDLRRIPSPFRGFRRSWD